MVSDEAAGRRPTVEELEADVRSANDKERLIGLVAAPLAAVVGILVISTLIVNDPPARLSNGQIDTLHVSLSLYYDLGAVILVSPVLMLVTTSGANPVPRHRHSPLRTRHLQPHYWGFGVPFILLSSWLLVRAYRLQHDLRAAGEDGLLRAGTQNEGRSTTPPRSSPKPSSRYTPPAAAPRRSSAPRPGNRQRAR